MIRQKDIDRATEFFFLSFIPLPPPQHPINIHISWTPTIHPSVTININNHSFVITENCITH